MGLQAEGNEVERIETMAGTFYFAFDTFEYR